MNIPKITHAAVLYDPRQPLALEEIEIPELMSGQCLVKIAFTGICYTQLLEARGKKGEDKYLPHLLGHEASGTVVAVANDVTVVHPTDRVVLSWIKGKGINAPGPKYRNRHGKTINAGQIATFSELAVVSENRCTPVPDSLPLHCAALLGCAVPTGAGILFNELRAEKGRTLVVFGAGGIGLSAILAGAFKGCSPIVAVDVSDEKLRFAASFGATHSVNAKMGDPVKSLKAILPNGSDYVIESSGNKSAMEAAYESVRDGGGTLVIAGNLTAGERIQIDPYNLIKGKHLLGTVGGDTRPDVDIPLYGKLFLDGQFNIEKLVHSYLTLNDVNLGLEQLEKGVLGRQLIKF